MKVKATLNERLEVSLDTQRESDVRIEDLLNGNVIMLGVKEIEAFIIYYLKLVEIPATERIVDTGIAMGNDKLVAKVPTPFLASAKKYYSEEEFNNRNNPTGIRMLTSEELLPDLYNQAIQRYTEISELEGIDRMILMGSSQIIQLAHSTQEILTDQEGTGYNLAIRTELGTVRFSLVEIGDHELIGRIVLWFEYHTKESNAKLLEELREFFNNEGENNESVESAGSL